MDGEAADGRVGAKIAACFTAITRRIVCAAPLLFSLQQQNRRAPRKTGKARNKSGKLVKKRPGRRKILSKQKANALKRGRKKEERLSAFQHFTFHCVPS